MSNIIKEIWKPIEGYIGIYEVSNLGKIKHLAAGKRNKMDAYGDKEFIVKTKLSRSYEQVCLINEYGIRSNYYIHRLVAIAFCENKNNYKYVNHIDENKINNKATNLEWCNAFYNNTYNNRAKLAGSKKAKSIDIYRIKNGEKIFLETIRTITDIRLKYGISYQAFYKYVDTDNTYVQRITNKAYKFYYHYD